MAMLDCVVAWVVGAALVAPISYYRPMALGDEALLVLGLVLGLAKEER
jgi:hypothetical protein